MTMLRQIRLVAAREIRERLRSPVYYLSLALMVVSVASFILLPALLEGGADRKEVAIAGSTPDALTSLLEGRAATDDTELRVRRYASVGAGEEAVREGRVDVLVVDGTRLEWRRRADEQLAGVVTGAIQLLAVRERALAAGISPETLAAVVAPVRVRSVELGQVAGRTPDDETATYVLSLVLFLSVSVYGGMVLTGVVEEKSSRVVEVLLARIPARSLLAGKVAGIGLLGLAQVVITGLAAVVATALSGLADVPVARGSVVTWAIVWFVIGYALIATAYGVLGSLASRSEDASSVTGPVSVVLIGAYFVSFAAVGSPDSAWAKAASWFPVTAPFAMPNRIAMGAAAWWEPFLAAVLALAAIAGLVVLGGRVYTHAILHTGGIVRLGDAWRGAASPARGHEARDRRASLVLVGAVGAVGAGVIAVSHDVVLGVTVAVILFVVGSRTLRGRRASPSREPGAASGSRGPQARS